MPKVSPPSRSRSPKPVTETLLDKIKTQSQSNLIEIKKPKGFDKSVLDYVIVCILLNNVKFLTLENLKLDDDDICLLSEAVKGNTSLIGLNLSKNNFGNRGVIAILSAVKNHPSISNLNISNNDFDDYDENSKILNGFYELFKHNIITVLNISNTKITDTLASVIAKCYFTNTSITNFNCKNCCIGEIGIYKIALSILQNTQMSISNFDLLQKERLTYDTFVIFIELWNRDKLLKNINLSKYNFVKDSFHRLLCVLKNNHTIETLNIMFNINFTLAMTQELIKFIPRTNIKFLNIIGYLFNDECAKVLGGLIYYQNNLLTISIANGTLTNLGYNYICSGLRHNTSIVKFSIDGVPVNYEPVNTIIDGFISRNVLLRDNASWTPRIHLDFKHYNSDSNKKIDDLVVTTLLCNRSQESTLPILPIELWFYIFSFYTRKMFY